MTYNKELWGKIVELGKSKEKGIANKLRNDEITTIIATMDFFGASEIWIKQSIYDLKMPRFRVFDWLAMSIMGRNDDNRDGNNTALKVLVNSYLNADGDVNKFIENLRINDYQIYNEWQKIEIEVN